MEVSGVFAMAEERSAVVINLEPCAYLGTEPASLVSRTRPNIDKDVSPRYVGCVNYVKK